jgi:hypothetical protein
MRVEVYDAKGEAVMWNIKGWLAVLGVFGLFVFEVFLIVRGAEAVADRMLSEMEKHPELTALLNDPKFNALQNAVANALVVALIVAAVGSLALGIYETTIDAATVREISRG